MLILILFLYSNYLNNNNTLVINQLCELYNRILNDEIENEKKKLNDKTEFFFGPKVAQKTTFKKWELLKELGLI